MRVIIPTRAYLPRMRAHLLFKPEDITFVVNDDEAMARIHTLLPRANVIVSGISREVYGPGTISHVREFISQQVLDQHEWAILLDDNVERVTSVAPEFYHLDRIRFNNYGKTSKEWREIYSWPCSQDEIYGMLDELKAQCETMGTIYGGFAAEENYYFRANKWSYASYVKAKLAVFRNDRSLHWTAFEGGAFEDFVMSAQVIQKYGCVVVNRFGRMHNEYYEAGGIGSEAERRELLKANCQWLVDHFPGLVKFRPGYDWQVQFAIRTLKSLERWREERRIGVH